MGLYSLARHLFTDSGCPASFEAVPWCSIAAAAFKFSVLPLLAFYLKIKWRRFILSRSFRFPWHLRLCECAYNCNLIMKSCCYYSFCLGKGCFDIITLFHVLNHFERFSCSPSSHGYMVLRSSTGWKRIHRRRVAQGFILRNCKRPIWAKGVFQYSESWKRFHCWGTNNRHGRLSLPFPVCGLPGSIWQAAIIDLEARLTLGKIQLNFISRNIQSL